MPRLWTAGQSKAAARLLPGTHSDDSMHKHPIARALLFQGKADEAIRILAQRLAARRHSLTHGQGAWRTRRGSRLKLPRSTQLTRRLSRRASVINRELFRRWI